MLNSEKPFPRMKKFESVAIKTLTAPRYGPKNIPVVGPKNWKNVKDWLSAPRTEEKLMLYAMIESAANSAMNNILLLPKKFTKAPL